MALKLDELCVGDLIRAKDNLRKHGKITRKEFNAITKYLGFIINDEHVFANNKEYEFNL